MSSLPDTRHSLILRLGNTNDPRAWEEFVDVYQRTIFRYARGRGLQQADAEDVTQQVFEAVMAKAVAWDPAQGGSFGAWIFHVTRNLAAKRWNQQCALPVQQVSGSGTDWISQIHEATTEERQSFRFEYRTALFHWAAERVRPKINKEHWSAFWRNAVESKTAEVVASELGISKSTVYVAKCRVMKKIRAEVERFGQDFSEHVEIH